MNSIRYLVVGFNRTNEEAYHVTQSQELGFALSGIKFSFVLNENYLMFKLTDNQTGKVTYYTANKPMTILTEEEFMTVNRFRKLRIALGLTNYEPEVIGLEPYEGLVPLV